MANTLESTDELWFPTILFSLILNNYCIKLFEMNYTLDEEFLRILKEDWR